MNFSKISEGLKSLWLVLNQPLFPVGDQNVTVGTLLAVVVVLIFTRRAARMAGNAVGQVIRRRELGDEGTIASFARLTEYVVLAAGAVVGVQLVGIDVGTVFTAGAVFAVGIGFALQSIAQNFVSGVILLIERTTRPGDVVEVDGELVRIQELGIRATRALTLDGEALIIPNSTLVQSNVRNFSLLGGEVRVRVGVGVAYGSDYPGVRQVLEACATSLSVKEPVVLLKGFGSSSVDFEVSIWIRDAFKKPVASSDLAFAVAAALKDADVTIAFPQLDVHVIGAPPAA